MEELFGGFSLGLFFWQTILFLALVFLLKKFAWKPILDSVNEREEGIKNALDSAEKAKLEMENLQADNQKLLKEARLERETMLKEARDIKKKSMGGLSGGVKSGPPPKKGPAPQGLKNGGCPYRESNNKNKYPGHNGIQIKGFKFTGVR